MIFRSLAHCPHQIKQTSMFGNGLSKCSHINPQGISAVFSSDKSNGSQQISIVISSDKSDGSREDFAYTWGRGDKQEGDPNGSSATVNCSLTTWQ